MGGLLDALKLAFVRSGKPLYLLLLFLIILSYLIVKAFLRLVLFIFLLIKTIVSKSIKLPQSVVLPRVGLSFVLNRKLGLGFITKRKLLLLGLSFSMLSLVLYSFWFYILKDLPDIRELTYRDLDVSTKIYDRNGVLLYTIYKDKNRSLISLSELPNYVRLATLAAEDIEFYEHPGFSLRGILRAFIKNTTEGKQTGGSTITQQLIKNALLSPEKTVSRKLKEVVLSIEAERVYTKDQILEMYLNEVSYGGTAYGISEASKYYFNKDARSLNLAESALLAALPKSPTKLSPFSDNPERSKERQVEILGLMKENGFITDEEMVEASNFRLNYSTNKTDILAPHFVMYVRNLLADKYGEDVIARGGLSVITTLDYSLQKMAEEAVSEEIFKIKKLNVSNGASLIIHPASGEILAMVGSKDYFEKDADGNVNVTTRVRQPGSSIKIINYAYALSNGWSAASIIDDAPISYNIPGQAAYTPRNYDGGYRGKITLRSAFAESRNIPAVRVLASYGVAKMIDLGKRMGISTWENPFNYGLSLTLGGGGVTLLDLAEVYATVANYGIRPQIATILEIRDRKDKIIYKRDCKETYSPTSISNAVCGTEQVIDPRVAFILIDILRDNTARSPAFGRNSALNIPGHPEVAVKTGTSNDLRDNLTIGFNQKYLVASWVGNNDNSPMSRLSSGITGAAPIWNSIMTQLIINDDNHSWGAPTGLIQIDICSYTGTLPCSGCPTRKEWFLAENTPTTRCLGERVQEKDENKKEG